MKKEVLMIRLGEGFNDDEITNIEVADFRIISNGRKKEYETDYTFELNGKRYRSNEYICRNANGKLKRPICFKHELIRLN